MKNLAFILGGMLTCCFCAEAQQYTESFIGYDGFGTYNESASTAGTLTYSTPPSTPFSAVISGTSTTSGGTANTSPNLFVTGSIGASDFSTVTLNGTAEVAYNLKLNCPSGLQSVFLTGSLGGNVTAFENTTPPIYNEMASSSIFIGVAGSTNVVYSATGSTSDSSPAPYQTSINSQAINLVAGLPYTVQLSASINLNGTISPGSSATASGTADVDPFFTLDPAEIAAGYSLEFSPGISNVPEPSDWALFPGGAGILVVFKKRTRIKA
ncbi:MAG TPA: hypothetical protein VNV43_02120 [Candidatus Acidoferrales bacterium]|jgi:hypothetical protein|nr:hypothetical protein [Candidatus Acidoferrales bacterium]